MSAMPSDIARGARRRCASPSASPRGEPSARPRRRLRRRDDWAESELINGESRRVRASAASLAGALHGRRSTTRRRAERRTRRERGPERLRVAELDVTDALQSSVRAASSPRGQHRKMTGLSEAQAHHLTPPRPRTHATSWMTGRPPAPGASRGTARDDAVLATRNCLPCESIHRGTGGRPMARSLRRIRGMSRRPAPPASPRRRVGRLGLVRRPRGRPRAGRRRRSPRAADAGRSMRHPSAPLRAPARSGLRVRRHGLRQRAPRRRPPPPSGADLRAGPDGQHAVRDAPRLSRPDARRRRRGPADAAPRARRACATRLPGAPSSEMRELWADTDEMVERPRPAPRRRPLGASSRCGRSSTGAALT